ncbi:hypothetical protein P22_1957 [Propionispora sp. 2/2-37]|uniref:DUF2577 domain-containing protein n=1 Tax=Propionispora sp. 2/2-37 TaxID=1677858 RepID=UPI0006BB6F3F|nr:DUF2577 domain-containing protein [Propionispora sp. 2/2-37]CUH95871.1 hypothetical protein P22_1957 [Propionispora sp. 2/2-37]
MSAELLQVFQTLIGQTMQAGQLADYVLGVVESSSPLSIRIEQKETITEEFLILTDAVRDYDVDIEVSHVTENRAGGSGDPAFASHNHDYTGRKKIRVYNGLHVGENVILLRQAGGQEFVVLSRVFNHTNLTGQWG